MKNKVLLCLFLIASCVGPLLAADTIRFVNNEYHAHFKGVLWQVVENDSIYKGVLVDSTLEKQHGFFTKDLYYQNYACYFSDCFELVSIEGDNDFRMYKFDSFYFQTDNHLSNHYKCAYNDERAFVGCLYEPNKWFMGTGFDGNKYGLRKDGKKYTIAGDDNWDEWGLKYFFYGLLIWLFWFLLLVDIAKLLFNENCGFMPILFSIVPITFTVLMYVLIPHDVLCYQLFLPLTFFLILWLISPENKHARYLYKGLAYCVVIFFVFFNNFIVNDKIIIGGEEKVVKWKAGTGILKRYIITNELEKLQEVTVDIQHGGKYPLYVGKEVLTDGMFDAVIGSQLWWVSCLQGKLNKPITYREYIYFLDRLKDITGLDNLDLLRYDELKDLNDKDSILLEEELNELTSSYHIRFQAIDDNRMISIYDNIVYADSSCVDSNGKLSDNYCYKYKNAVIYDATARLVIRKKEGRHFDVMGIKIDQTNNNLPDSIRLLSINGNQIEKLCYEKFEELEIESFYKNRTIEFVTNYLELPKKLYQHAGRTDYWYIPMFSYD